MRIVALLALFVAAAPAALADSWMPFADRRVVSPSGRHYAVVTKDRSGTTFELVRRRESALPIEPVDGRGEEEVARDERDELLIAGDLPQAPLRVRVLDEPAGVVFFENYGMVGHRDSLIVAIPGKPLVRRTLSDIVGAEAAARFREERSTVSSIWWYAGFLVSEEERRVLIVTAEDTLYAVSFDGAAGKAGKEALLDHLDAGTEEERAFALEVAGRLRPEGLGPRARALALDGSRPEGIRLRAAVAAKRAGEEVGQEALFLKCVEKGNPASVRSFAASHLGEMLGIAALPVLRRLMRGKADNDVWNPAKDGLRSLGAAAVPTLVDMLGEEGESADYRGGAAHVLGELGAKEAVPALLAAVTDGEEYVANAALNAAIAIGDPDLGRSLAAILAKGSTQDARIASYFREHPAESARPALKAALERAVPGSYEARAIEAALAALDR